MLYLNWARVSPVEPQAMTPKLLSMAKLIQFLAKAGGTAVVKDKGLRLRVERTKRKMVKDSLSYAIHDSLKGGIQGEWSVLPGELKDRPTADTHT